ncbi:peptidoglycan binding protein CsiV [Fluoribacter gormanii]|uniref:CsiV family protein n=1 Tax=Fluoribacter gormanii TaxID=464 RepID=UPI001041187E|nr:CsiV family protein [Fluoribacter gormanii]MCW8444030.1 peptidoglycan binding protein CsiV [Fluoribacter gormanii]MCW8469212.1 peptidoglycan binding protein CsiV [Fluoribacter gormanii]
MERLIIITLSLLYSCLTLAKPSYQIDLIIFAQPNQNRSLSIDTPLIPTNANAIYLKTDTDKSGKPYHLLSPSSSSLRDEYYLLSRRSNYQVLGHYSWRQPANNQSTVALPFVDHYGWQMQGTLNVKQSNYYFFDAEFQVSPPNNPQSSFTVSQKQRLKDDVVYYLDNAQIGMLVKIHKVG